METILKYKYQITLEEYRKQFSDTQNNLAEKQRDYETLKYEIAKALRGESKFKLPLLQSILEETEQKIEQETTRLYELEAKLRNAELIRHEIEVKQRKYCGLNYIFLKGTMEEKKMLLSILVSKIGVRKGYELNIQLAPDFEQFLDGLIEMR